MKESARAGLLLATVAGLVLAGWVLRSIGIAAILDSVRSIGLVGLASYCLYSLVVFMVLGGAWLAAAPTEHIDRLPLYSWARVVREAVSELLPFAQVGGLVIGARVITSAGVRPVSAFAAMTVDLTTEMASQVIFTLFGIVSLAAVLSGNSAVLSAASVSAAALAAITALLLLGGKASVSLAGRLAERFLPGTASGLRGVEAELAASYARRDRVALSFVLNLLAWIASGAGAWLLLRLIGTPLDLWAVLAIESLIFTVRSVAFIVPGAIGFQEAAYAAIGPLFGLPAEAALALSLAKRARDVAIGLPALLIWQANEARIIWRSST